MVFIQGEIMLKLPEILNILPGKSNQMLEYLIIFIVFFVDISV
jgi:hypothetical protein